MAARVLIAHVLGLAAAPFEGPSTLEEKPRINVEDGQILILVLATAQ